MIFRLKPDSHLVDDSVRDLARPDRRRVVAVLLHVVGDAPPLGDDGCDGRLEPVGGLGLLQVAQHHDAREHHRHRVHPVLTLVLRRRPMRGLEDRRVHAEVSAGCKSEAADQARGEIGDDVAVEVREHENLVFLRTLHELHREVVDDPVLELDVAVRARHLAGDLQVEAVGELHDVGLVHGRHLVPAISSRVVEREFDDSSRSRHRDRLDRDARVRLDRTSSLFDPGDQLASLLGTLLELDARVEILGVLAYDDEVDGVVA